MRLHYRVNDNEIEIIRCFGNDSKVILPDRICGLPVTKAAPYTFSDHKSQEDAEYEVYESGGHILGEDEIYVLAGPEVEEIIFPDTMCEIGNYIFYGCKNLKRLEFSDALIHLGSGAFTGCISLSSLWVNMKAGHKSCVKEILGELWQRIDVTFFYEEDGERADLVFPVHYEEAVENTPARLLYTQHHGSGNNYRQCFYNNEMDYRKYDSLFSVAVVWDKVEVLTDMALGRLAYPYELMEKYERLYQEMIVTKYKDALKYLIGREKFQQIKLLSERDLWNVEMIDYALELASGQQKAEISSYLMNEKQERFSRKRKVFEL
ncbi:MAG: leucine-rich repeat protein [Muricomes sp.]